MVFHRQLKEFSGLTSFSEFLCEKGSFIPALNMTEYSLCSGMEYFGILSVLGQVRFLLRAKIGLSYSIKLQSLRQEYWSTEAIANVPLKIIQCQSSGAIASPGVDRYIRGDGFTV